MRIATLISTAALLFASHAYAFDQVFFAEPRDGGEVVSPFKIRFGVQGLKVSTAGDMTPGTGHHHLIINGTSVAQGESVPFDQQHLHFGKGQTETELNLPTGEYTLTMQFGNGAHQSYGPDISRTIHIKVIAERDAQPVKINASYQ